MTIETPGPCRNGHDPGVFGKTTANRCRACYHLSAKLVDQKRRNTVNRQLSLAKARLKYRMNRKIARIDELERMLNA